MHRIEYGFLRWIDSLVYLFALATAHSSSTHPLSPVAGTTQPREPGNHFFLYVSRCIHLCFYA